MGTVYHKYEILIKEEFSNKIIEVVPIIFEDNLVSMNYWKLSRIYDNLIKINYYELI